MRRSILLVVLVLAAGLAGCGVLDRNDEDDKLARLLDEGATVSVFLRDDVTDAEREGVETRLKAVPDNTGVTYESKDEAYAKFKELWVKSNPEFLEKVEPGSLPESFRVQMTNMAALRKAEGSTLEAELKALPGVQDVVFPGCTTVDECKKKLAPSATP
ncbi:hypothetical protein GCM10010435_07340 [Winogradskya consettensis]|uniref:FtsX extracellular domain-containing protein n=1 Tax=Winogradskya consettensis TaxID=113560 RepID=A0A919SP20_9ACTN|nr:permease-like cell division protein FtsX [Actinoplanes consettensis]GIM75751.1 hypothetical protein Aco04nite_46900 [Actinoplanes consettensis]